MSTVRLSHDQEALLRACGSLAAGSERAIRFQTSPDTGSILLHPDFTSPVPIAIVDLWDLHEDGLVAVDYGETAHEGSVRLTDRGAQALADLMLES